MTYLLDTHYMLWALTDTKRLPKKVKEILTNPECRVVVSAISFWEVSLKSSLGKLELKGKGFTPEQLPGFCKQIGFEVKGLSAETCSTYHKLKATYHKDPFDRMLIWEAITNDYTFITVDANIGKYITEGLSIL